MTSEIAFDQSISPVKSIAMFESVAPFQSIVIPVDDQEYYTHLAVDPGAEMLQADPSSVYLLVDR